MLLRCTYKTWMAHGSGLVNYVFTPAVPGRSRDTRPTTIVWVRPNRNACVETVFMNNACWKKKQKSKIVPIVDRVQDNHARACPIYRGCLAIKRCLKIGLVSNLFSIVGARNQKNWRKQVFRKPRPLRQRRHRSPLLYTRFYGVHCEK